jgi:N-hydroxyarylamine O-acetyltransferase
MPSVAVIDRPSEAAELRGEIAPPPASGIDLAAYLGRIGYEGEHAPTLATLQAIVAGQSEAIAFENLDPLLGWPVRLDAESLQRKLVRDGRGGYCFEQNLLLHHALEGLGFRVTGLGARILWNAADGVVPPRGHMLLLVHLPEGRFLVDVGFGGQTPTSALRLEPGLTQATPHEAFRVQRAGEDFVLQVDLGGSWRALYQFDLRQHHFTDYEVSNWFVSTHPSSHFVHELLAARPAPGKRFALRDNLLVMHQRGRASQRRVLKTAAELRQTLDEVFGIAVPEGAEVESLLERLVRRRG